LTALIYPSMNLTDSSSSTLTVKCYSGHTYAEEPRSFTLDGAVHEVAAVAKAWREPDRRCFLVRTGDSKLFQLCYNEAIGSWSASEVVRR
jgi:hypothetical protein